MVTMHSWTTLCHAFTTGNSKPATQSLWPCLENHALFKGIMNIIF